MVHPTQKGFFVMDKGVKDGPMPDVTEPKNWGAGVLQSFKTAGKASANEFCEKCGNKIGGKMPGCHCPNPCGGKGYRK